MGRREPAAVSDVAHGIIAPGANAQPADTSFTAITVSPSYSHDHTVFASGVVVNGCQRAAQCPVLFRTTDGGHSWTNVHPTGFLGGTIVLPPSWPKDPVIFAAGQAGLERATTGAGRSSRPSQTLLPWRSRRTRPSATRRC